MKKQKKMIILIISILVVVSLIFALKNWLGFKSYKKAMEDTAVSEVDFSGIADGTYQGSHDVGYIRAVVDVTVKDGGIESVDIIEHFNDRGDGAERVAEDIVVQQKITVDTVAGVTNSSLVIEKAVENALSGGLN